jgi:hypothetical protein
MSLFDRFVRKEKFNRNTGKFEVTQEGLNLGFSPGEEVDPLNEAVKDFYADKKKKKREKRKATGVKIFNSYMDLSERFVKSQSDPKNPMNKMFGVQKSSNTHKKKSRVVNPYVPVVNWWEK